MYLFFPTPPFHHYYKNVTTYRNITHIRQKSKIGNVTTHTVIEELAQQFGNYQE